MRRRDVKRLKEEAGALIGTVERNIVGRAEIDGTIVYLFNGAVILARRDDILFPTLTNPGLERLPSVYVDMGAVPFVCNGADVMAPGITEVSGEFEEGELVVVRDVKHGKGLAVGKALVTSVEMREMKKGKTIRNLHYVGDKLWKVVG